MHPCLKLVSSSCTADPRGWGEHDISVAVPGFSFLYLLKEFAFSALFLFAFQKEFCFGFLGSCHVESRGAGNAEGLWSTCLFIRYEKCNRLIDFANALQVLDWVSLIMTPLTEPHGHWFYKHFTYF